ncbi:MAG: ATP-binding protein [Flavobacteriales bacterium]|nr:ATP-binding protein [Flavobacteriales bacterium]
MKALMVIFECEAGLETTEGVIAHVDQQQFALVIQNLFINMAKHGLRSDQEQLVVRVRVSTRIEPQRTRLVITIENNGKPFPEGFTHEHFITFGKRLDMKKGNGIGGYLIDRIIANHGGKFVSGNLPVSDDKYRSSFERDQRIDENHWIPFDREAVSTQMFVHFTIDLPISHDTV